MDNGYAGYALDKRSSSTTYIEHGCMSLLQHTFTTARASPDCPTQTQKRPRSITTALDLLPPAFSAKLPIARSSHMTSRPTGQTTANALVAKPVTPHGIDFTTAQPPNKSTQTFGNQENGKHYPNNWPNMAPPTEVRAWREFLHEDHSEVFTDGGCHLPQDQWLKSGAWAVVQATPTGFHTLHSQRLTGVLQGSDRAEIYAIEWACRWAALHQHTINTGPTMHQPSPHSKQLPRPNRSHRTYHMQTFGKPFYRTSNKEPSYRCTRYTATRNDLPTQQTFGHGRATWPPTDRPVMRWRNGYLMKRKFIPRQFTAPQQFATKFAEHRNTSSKPPMPSPDRSKSNNKPTTLTKGKRPAE